MFFVDLLRMTLLVAIGVLIVWLIVRGRHPRAAVDAREILDSRYARGELDRDAYLRIRTELTDSAPIG